MSRFWEEDRCNVVIVILCSQMTPFVIYSIGLFASLSLLLGSGRRDRFTWAGFFEVKMQTRSLL